MQVTQDMADAAFLEYKRLDPNANVLPSVMRRAMQAALDAATVDLPVTATVRVQIDEQAFRASAAEAVQRLYDGLPRDEDGRVTLASLRGTPTDAFAAFREATKHLLPGDQLHVAALLGYELPDVEADIAKRMGIPVTEPRPLARQSALHLHLGIGEVAMARMIRFRDDYRPPTPLPIHEATADSEALYDPEEVKAWYDALPQASDG